MNKIVLTFVFATSLVIPFSAQAMGVFSFPVNVTVIVNTDNNDGTFHFSIPNPFNPFDPEDLLDNFDITTQNHTGSFNSPSAVAFFNSGSFEIKEALDPNWQVNSVTCSGNGLLNTTYPYYGQNDVYVTAFAGTDVTCIFNNTHKNTITPVLIVPGIMGTEMKKNNEILWANPSMVNPLNSDSFMDPLSFNNLLKAVDSEVNISDIFRKKSLGPITYDYSSGLITSLQNQGYVENQTLFTFPYDWRYGVTGGDELNVKALAQKITDLRAQTGTDKIDVVAHSTGGLLVKKYLEEHPSDNHIGKTIFVGVPNLGAPKTVKVLLQGDNFGVLGLNDGEIKKITKNMPVAYELLPSVNYFNTAGSFLGVATSNLFQQLIKDLNYDESKDFLLNDYGLNATAFQNAVALHSASFDSFDSRDAGADVYNIIGCKSGTLGKLTETNRTNIIIGLQSNFVPHFISGDGTVPYESAETIPTDDNKKFYVKNANHGQMLSQNGIRQQIVNILTGGNLPTENILTEQEFSQSSNNPCNLNGVQISIFSPVDIAVTDVAGNRLGIAQDGSLQNDIPGADFEIFGDHKFVYLPKNDGVVNNGNYTINLRGTDTGTFTLKSSEIVNGETTETFVWSNLPVTPELEGGVSLNNNEPPLTLDTNGDGVTDQTPPPSAVLNGNQSEDLVAPATGATISGAQGKTGFYRSGVAVTLTATDPIIPEHEAETSGVLTTHYNLDNTGFVDYIPAALIRVANEGPHQLVFYSTDKAGNNELEQAISFTIDTTPPEIIVQFDPSRKDLKFTGSDNLSTASAIVVNDRDNNITVTDEAGNKTEITLKDKNRKKNLHAEIKTLRYNNLPADLGKNKMSFEWQFNKMGNLKELKQKVRNKKDYNIEAMYENGKTKLEGKDQSGKINKTLSGLVLLNVSTSRGDLNWNY